MALFTDKEPIWDQVDRFFKEPRTRRQVLGGIALTMGAVIMASCGGNGGTKDSTAVAGDSPTGSDWPSKFQNRASPDTQTQPKYLLSAPN